MPLLAPLTGIGQYVHHLFSAMRRIEAADVDLYYGLLRTSSLADMPTVRPSPSARQGYEFLRRWLPQGRHLKRLAEQVMFGYHLRRQYKDALYHEPNHLPLAYAGPTVLTVCDLSCFDHPETHPAERVRMMERHLPRALERVDHILVISDATGQALRERFGVPVARMTRTHLAAGPQFAPQSPLALSQALPRFGLTAGHYLLCVGTLEPRKNLPNLFAAYGGLPPALRKRFPLVVAGMKGWHTEGLMKSAQGLLERGELRLLGYVEDELLPSLYAGAAAFCYPSRYEGFGLPALEAMASGTPVLTSNRTSLPEVVGAAGIMTDPDDVTGMRDALQQLLEDPEGARELGRQGLIRAQQFSWDRCARETFAVYQKVMNQRGFSS